MNNEKILNLSDVETEDFEAIKGAIEDWKDSGYPGKFVFVTEKEAQECLETLRDTFQDVYNRGVWRGGLALAGGFLIGAVLYRVGEYLITEE